MLVMLLGGPAGLRARLRLYRPGDRRLPYPRTEAKSDRLRLFRLICAAVA